MTRSDASSDDVAESSGDFFERRIGTVIKKKWTLEKLLGVGGMAAIYSGRHHIGRCDAIKILHATAGRLPEMRARFEQEALAVGRLGHPGAVRIDDIDTTEDGSLYLVMELLEGESLGDRLERGASTPDDALRWADEVLDVLSAAHAMGIVHRDIKPDNLFLLNDGRVKLLDFGVAHMRDSVLLKTATGVALGTLPYMAPEQVRGEAIDARADLFGLGATLVRAIGRCAVHEVATETMLYLAMGTEPVPPAKALLPSAPESLWPIIDHALAFDRDRRYPTATAMREDIQAVRAGRLPDHALAALRVEPLVRAPTSTFAGTKGNSAVEGALGPPMKSSLPPRTIAVLIGSVVAGIALAVAVLLALSGPESPGEVDSSPRPVSS